MTQRGGIAGCYDLDQVDVCWFPYTANGNTGLCLDYQGNYPFATFAKGDGVCVQSVNQTVKAPNCTRDLSARPAQSGYTWVYKNATGETGWVLTNAITSAAGNAGCCGPAQVDYQCGSGNASKCSSAPCDGSQSYSPTVASVSGNRQINGPDGYASLRLGPGSTTLYYLPNNACVTRRLTIGNDSLWTCVVVQSGAGGWCPVGTTGWVLSSSLGGSC